MNHRRHRNALKEVNKEGKKEDYGQMYYKLGRVRLNEDLGIKIA